MPKHKQTPAPEPQVKNSPDQAFGDALEKALARTLPAEPAPQAPTTPPVTGGYRRLDDGLIGKWGHGRNPAGSQWPNLVVPLADPVGYYLSKKIGEPFVFWYD